MIPENTLSKLEFQKILNYVAGYANTKMGREKLLDSVPLNSLELILKEGEFVTEAKEILINNDIPPFVYLPDLKNFTRKKQCAGNSSR